MGMKNDFNIATSTLVATEMTTGVIAGFKTPAQTILADTRTTPIYAVDSLDGTDTIRNIVARLSALERIRSGPLYKIESCPNCGGSMQLHAEDHILKCRYCRSVVFVGIKNINR